MKYIQIALTMRQSVIGGIDGCFNLARFAHSHGFAITRACTDQMPLQANEIENYLLEKKKDAVQEKPTQLWDYMIILCGHLQGMDHINSSLAFQQFQGNRNQIRLGGLVEFEITDQSAHVEPYAQNLLRMAHHLYVVAHPVIGWVDESGGNIASTKDSKRLSIKTISWVNLFGPGIVEKYGRDFLMSIPGYKVELLPDGGVYHQLAKNFTATTTADMRIRSQVIAHFRRHNIRVTCSAPYRL